MFSACSSSSGDDNETSDVITISAIQGVTPPAFGEEPVTTITGTEQYTGTVTWEPTVSGTFAASADYTAIITLTPKSGYTLQGVEEDFFAVAGALTVSNDANSGVIYAEFPTTGSTPSIPIDIAIISGVTIPVTGETPVTAITETAQYTGTVTWSPNHATFAASTGYTAIITLTPKSGYTLQGVGANFFTVVGTSSAATNLVDSGEVTAKFPLTEASAPMLTVIDIAAISGVTIPVTGETPVTAITETAQYTGIVTWLPNHATFAASTDYTAIITLTPKSGYTLQGVGANFFTVAGTSSAATNLAGSGEVTAEFPSTEASAPILTVIDIAAIQGVTVPVSGISRGGTSITSTVQYTGNISWSPNDTTFRHSTVYTATITLTARSGYTLQGVGANFFTVAGATASSNSANSGVITAVFLITDPPILGVNWRAVTPGTSDGSSTTFDTFTNINGIAYGAGKFVAVGDSGKMAWSTDGISWYAIPVGTSDGYSTTFDTTTIRGIAYGAGKFVAVGHGGKKAYSTDGTSWYAIPVTDTTNLYSIVYGVDKFVAVGQYGIMAWSTTGDTGWTAVTTTTFGSSFIFGIVYGVDKFVAVGSGGGIMAWSTTGDTGWTAVATTTFTSPIYGIAYGDGKFVAVGFGEMAWSTAGTSWTAVTAPESALFDIRCIAYGGDKFVTGGNSGRMAYSTDGINYWTAITPGSTNGTTTTFGTGSYIYGIAYGDGKFVAVGANGKIAYSPGY